MNKGAWKPSKSDRRLAFRLRLKFGRYLISISAAREAILSGEVGTIDHVRFVDSPKRFRDPMTFSTTLQGAL